MTIIDMITAKQKLQAKRIIRGKLKVWKPLVSEQTMNEIFIHVEKIIKAIETELEYANDEYDNVSFFAGDIINDLRELQGSEQNNLIAFVFQQVLMN